MLNKIIRKFSKKEKHTWMFNKFYKISASLSMSYFLALYVTERSDEYNAGTSQIPWGPLGLREV